MDNGEQQGVSKAGFGFLTAFFLGIFGLIFMICWPAGSYERKSFVRGWLITFLIMLVLEIVMIILYYTWIINLIKVATTFSTII